MTNARPVAGEHYPPSGEEAFDKIQEAIQNELAAIRALVEPNPDQPEAMPLWHILGSVGEVATELRRIRMSLEESRPVSRGPIHPTS